MSHYYHWTTLARSVTFLLLDATILIARLPGSHPGWSASFITIHPQSKSYYECTTRLLVCVDLMGSQTNRTNIQFRNLFSCTSAEIRSYCPRAGSWWWMWQAVLDVDEHFCNWTKTRTGKVSRWFATQGSRNQRRHLFANGIEEGCPRRHVEGAEGTDRFSRDDYVLNMERNTIPSSGLRQEIWQGVTLQPHPLIWWRILIFTHELRTNSLSAARHLTVPI